MNIEITLFWLVIAGFLLADNLVLVPVGGDHLRFGFRGRLRYRPGTEFQLRGRDLIALNPLNPFDRIALTKAMGGRTSHRPMRFALQSVRRALPGLNALSLIGSAYLLSLMVLALLSWQIPFGIVLVALATLHLAAWICLLVVTLRYQRGMMLSRYRILVLLVEAFFVPAYAVNLGKRAWYKPRLDLPALVVGLRELRRMPQGPTRELLSLQLAQRLETLANDQDGLALGRDRLPSWIEEARLCLKSSAPSNGL